MSYRVRHATCADIEELTRFAVTEEESGDMPCARLEIQAVLEDDSSFACWVIEYGYEIVATMTVVKDGALARPHWLIQSIYIEPLHRGRGLTRLLLGTVRREAQWHKVRSLTTLCTPKENGAQVCLFKGRLY